MNRAGPARSAANLLAASLAEAGRVEFHNLATSGARIADVAGRQLAAALALRPHLASVIVGVNDTLRDEFDPDTIGRALTGTIAALRASGAVVLTARLPDPGRTFGLPGPLARPLGRRMRAVNAITDAAADRHGTVHLDLTADPCAYDRRMWSIDRLHPGERGHRLIARCFADGLAAAGFPVRHRPSLRPTNRSPTRWARAWWMANQGTRWLLRRSTDLLPSLVAIVVAEWWQERRGGAARGAPEETGT
ncbi:MAG TPA: SGNH/GDSL hydrolase family protein [Pilimelia sp.]|nr:SGNH/GDSL hydrolase family protein [Pilimelia sp.]